MSSVNILPSFIFAVLIGPVLEELAFRKVLLDRLSCYSKKYTIILSGVMFGLFHTNLFQFFYACLIGIVFAYIYTITGKIRYTIILHMSVNFLHGIVPMMIYSPENSRDKVYGVVSNERETRPMKCVPFKLLR